MLADLPELRAFQDEPVQMRSGMPGKQAVLRLGYERRGDRTALVDMYRRAPLLVQKALYWDAALPAMPCVMIIHTSGCVLQGDRLDIEISLAPDTQAHVTSQAATKIHQMDANYAAQSQSISLQPGAYLEYMPGVIIPHKRSRFVTQTTIRLAPDSVYVYADVLMPGRKYHAEGELFEYDLFSSTTSAQRHDGTPLFTDKFVIEPHVDRVRERGVMGRFDVVGNGLLLAPSGISDAVLERLLARFEGDGEVALGATRLPNDAGLSLRILGMETQPVKDAVREFWAAVRTVVFGSELPQEFLWR